MGTRRIARGLERGGGGVAVLSEPITVATTVSTNADLLALAKTGAPEGTWLRADEQTGGRGRQGRGWHSPPGNLYTSTLVRLRSGDPPAATLALVAAVALRDAVGVGTLKWPNDLLIGGAKLSGILLERADDAVVVGIGVNIVSAPTLDRPTTTLTEQGFKPAPAELLGHLATAFAARVVRWRADFAGIRAAWLAAAHPLGTPLTVNLADGGQLLGDFDGLADDGGLALRLASGERRVIHAGDVFQL